MGAPFLPDPFALFIYGHLEVLVSLETMKTRWMKPNFHSIIRPMERPYFKARIAELLEIHPVVAILGPRQCGKTTLARAYAREYGDKRVTVFDLEDPTDVALLDHPRLALQDLEGLVIIDEVQRAPALFEVLRVLVDREFNPCRFLILGSASRDLIQQSSETLAGRIAHLELTPFSLGETGTDTLPRLWLRGGFPPSYLAKTDAASAQWRKAYVSTFLERDIPALGIDIAPPSLYRFWAMLTHYHGQLVNYSELGRSFGVADTTVRRYLDILSATFMVRQLPPWYENIGKRQVKRPKLYFRDSGVFHSLLGVADHDTLRRHPKLGASWEGFAIEEIIRRYHAGEGEVYFWGTHGKAELDLLLMRNGKRYGFEVKYSDTPKVTRSLQLAREDLALDEVKVIYPGDKAVTLAEGIQAVGLSRLIDA